MSTTAGTRAFKSAKAATNGQIVQKLIDAGLIILGKTNMTVRQESISDKISVADGSRNFVA